jgi:hypothetical protein
MLAYLFRLASFDKQITLNIGLKASQFGKILHLLLLVVEYAEAIVIKILMHCVS